MLMLVRFNINYFNENSDKDKYGKIESAQFKGKYFLSSIFIYRALEIWIICFVSGVARDMCMGGHRGAHHIYGEHTKMVLAGEARG